MGKCKYLLLVYLFNPKNALNYVYLYGCIYQYMFSYLLNECMYVYVCKLLCLYACSVYICIWVHLCVSKCACVGV